MSACKNSCTEQQRKAHRHKGKSSESLLDKRLILSALNIQPGQRVLDAGCGNGYMTKEFIKIVGDKGKVFAIDPDEESEIVHLYFRDPTALNVNQEVLTEYIENIEKGIWIGDPRGGRRIDSHSKATSG